jgi:hypothetical protein
MLFDSNRMRDKQNLMPRMTGAFKKIDKLGEVNR